MRTLESTAWTPRVTNLVTTGVDSDSPVRLPEIEQRNRWQKVIDQQLIEWGRDPSRFADEDIVPPSPRILRDAARIAMTLHGHGVDAPDHAVPDAHGGIVFEWHRKPTLATLRLHASGNVEALVFLKGRLIHREPIVKALP